MRSGRLKRLVTVQSVTHAQDAYGETSETWAKYFSGMASIEPLSGTERFDAAALQGEIDHKVVMRYRQDVTPTNSMRVVYGSRVFDIQAVIEAADRRREWHLMCKEYFGDSTS